MLMRSNNGCPLVTKGKWLRGKKVNIKVINSVNENKEKKFFTYSGVESIAELFTCNADI